MKPYIRMWNDVEIHLGNGNSILKCSHWERIFELVKAGVVKAVEGNRSNYFHTSFYWIGA